MKYLYRNTGVIVESSTLLDSSMFLIIDENKKETEVKKTDTAAKKATARKTTLKK